MPLKVAAFYQFARLPDYRELREPLRASCAGLELKGSILLAQEGINGTLAGSDDAVDALVEQLQHGPLFGGRLDHLELKFSQAATMPFQRLKVRLKKEIVTLGDANVDPTQQVGIYVEQRVRGRDGNIRRCDRSRHQEFRTIQGICRATTRSGEAQEDRDVLHRRYPLREGQQYLVARGFGEVYHLKGGILKYLEGVPEHESRWRGECFVFDERVALGHGLRQLERGNDGADE